MDKKSSAAAPDTTSQAQTSVAADNAIDNISEQEHGVKATKEKPVFWRESLWLHAGSILLAILYVILVGVMHLPRYGVTAVGIFTLIGLIAPGMTLLVVCVPELVTRWLCPRNLGWIPAVHIGLSLLTWLSGLVTGAINAYLYPVFNGVDGDWEDGCPDSHASGLSCYGKPLLPLFAITITINFALAVTHFFLFLIAIRQHSERVALKRESTLA